ncbi:FtsK/SpoIIIE domain-containing protein [Fodinicola acaciae]|uniref:FtsK/SpoIIIE domain-containing protein n=1 Tax=Fodinicola acaciae TaxID=2681555 RepID=UPI0013D2D6D0|nr:FtsK/SpoIIIE domain-containing protein [Fodinicola acaciae]
MIGPRGAKQTTGLVVVSEDEVRDKWAVPLAILRAIGRLLRWVVMHPIDVAALVGLGWLWVQYGWPVPVIAVGVVGLALTAWAVWKPALFHRFALWPAVSRFRHMWKYQIRWRPAMTLCKLDATYNHRQYLPALVWVSANRWVDRVTVRMLMGQKPGHYTYRAEELARTFGVRECRISSAPPIAPDRTGRLAWLLRLLDRVRYRDHPDRVVLTLIKRDRLAKTVMPLAIPRVPNLRALPVAIREDGALYTLRLAGSHVLVAGATGSGKGSVIWSVIRSLAGAVHDGWVQLWVIDPKGGMELAFGRSLFHRFCYGEDDTADPDRKRSYEIAYAEFLEDLVVEMQGRQAKLRGVARDHTPSKDSPAVVVIIDELASLTAYVIDREAKKRIAAALALLASQGRAVGIYLLAALQDPRKEVLPFRDLFPTRIALRLVEDGQVDLVLGDGARDRGAYADLIDSIGQEGVAYVVLDGMPEPARMRFGWVSDDEIHRVAAWYAPGRHNTFAELAAVDGDQAAPGVIDGSTVEFPRPEFGDAGE